MILDKQSLAEKQRFFFDHYGVTENDLERYLAAALSAGGDYADLYFEYLSSTSLMVDESMVKSASQGISAGCGVRVVSGERTGYAYTDDLSASRILHAARTAALIASAPAKTPVAGFQQTAARSLYPVTLPSVDAEITAKVELIMRADKAARAYDPRIQEVRASYSDELRNILVVASDGTFAEDSQPLARLNVSCIAKTEGNSARGSAGGGGRVALDFFFGEKTPEFFAKEAARQAILQLDAREAPAGEMEVVLGPGWPGVLLHEAVGHGLEADFNRKRTSAFAGLIGKRVASEACTVVDNGTMPWRRGSLNVDDEGNSTQETVLIEKGILKGYLSDKLSEYRQRTPRELRTYPHAAHDQHLHAGGTGQSRRYYSFSQARNLRRELWRRPGRYHEWQIRLRGERSLHDRKWGDCRAHQRRNLNRQRPRCSHARVDGRQ